MKNDEAPARTEEQAGDDPWQRLVASIRKSAEPTAAGIVVAFSGGLDSAVLLDAALSALSPDRVLAFLAVSPSLSSHELGDARRIAKELGARLHEEPTNELEEPDYVANRGDRCYFCKRELFSTIHRVAQTAVFLPMSPSGVAPLIAYGYHQDDEADIRPGLRAALEAGALRPLYEAGLRKQDLRGIAERRGRSFATKASGACLSSRLAPGLTVTRERLSRVETIEHWLRQRGYSQVRARLDRDDLVRIETAPHELARLARELSEGGSRSDLLTVARAVGVVRVSLDLVGYSRPGES